MSYDSALAPEEAPRASDSTVRSAGTLAIRLADAARNAGRGGLIHLARDERVAEHLAELVRCIAADVEVLVLPPWDCLPYDAISPSRHVMGRRMASLYAMTIKSQSPWLLLSTIDAAVQRVPPRIMWDQDACLNLRVGEMLDLPRLQTFLSGTGYSFDERVDEPGAAAVRGQVVDIFPAGHESPVRIEYQDGRISEIHPYDPLTQRTSEVNLPELTLLPISEVLFSGTFKDEKRFQGIEHWLAQFHPRLETIFDYAPNAALSGAERLADRLAVVLEQIKDTFDAQLNARCRPGTAELRRTPPLPASMYLDKAAWDLALKGRKILRVNAEARSVPRFAQQRSPVTAASAFLRERIEQTRKVVLTGVDDRQLATVRKRMERQLSRKIEFAETWDDVRDAVPGAVLSMVLPIQRGFELFDEEAIVVAASDIFGHRVRTDRRTSFASLALVETQFKIGDAVIHLDHGMGVLMGLETVEAAGERSEMVRLEYAGGATLLVPTDEIAAIWRYGSEPDSVSLDKLDGEAWQKRCAKVEAEIAETAARLAELSEARAQMQARAFKPNTSDYDRFVARFPFSESLDQEAAIQEVLEDLGSGRPMDRLVCGDVGFGKTEVALRAAATVALSGAQVAVVAPTTILARQHLETFRRRFAGFGAETGQLSRLMKPAEMRDVKRGLADGRIRIVVGTHALTGKDVRFKDLGLLIIDEEQRFGTREKTKLRQLGAAAHVLVLTATPIPRTLQAAIAGIQDLSVIATPPVRRRPIRTILAAFDATLVQQALLRERLLGGQSFLVCPRIEDIEPMALKLRELVPELRCAVAHGKMPADQIDDVMLQFARGQSDVLLATNIIESGLDLPTANTMLVWRADRFGMSQLHQLRGRVGRGRRRGTAYLLTDPEKNLPAPTEKRLRSLEALDRLGAGFEISARDLDLRGAGDLIGDEQTGHIKLIGSDLYRRLLDQALAAARGDERELEWAPDINLGARPIIPEDYVPEPEVRLNIYARLARLGSLEDAEAFAEEIEDRFGTPPRSFHDLLSLTEAAILARGLSVAKIEGGPNAIALTFRDGRRPVEAKHDIAEWREDRLVIPDATNSLQERCALTLNLLRQLDRSRVQGRQVVSA